MKLKRIECAILLFACLLIFAKSAAGQGTTPVNGCAKETPKDYATWINCRIGEVVKAKITQRENTKQTETPSVAASSTSLVDQSSATDLVSAALNLAGLKEDSETSDKSFSFTASAYSLYAAAKSHDPLDPIFYNDNKGWRRFWVTLGQEIPEENGSTETERATIAALKILVWDKRDLSSRNFLRISEAIRNSAPNSLQIIDKVQNYLYDIYRERLNLMARPSPEDVETDPTLRRQFALDLQKFSDQKLDNPRDFEEVVKLLSEEDKAFITKIIEDHLGPEVDLLDVIREEITKIRKAPQFAVSFQSKTRKEGIDEYKTEAVFDYGVHPRINLSLNGSFLYMDSKTIGGDVRGGSASGQLQFQVTPEKVFAGGRNPIYVYLAGEGKWMNGMDSIGKIQTKIKVPLTEGIDLPISLTWANRTELIDEKEVRGQFGFTFDLARLAKAIGFK